MSRDPLQTQAEQIFAALDGLDTLQCQNTDGKKGFSFQTLFSYANDPSFQAEPAFLTALGQDLSLRRDLKRLLDKSAICTMGQRAAASTQEIMTRLEDDFELTLKTSQANPKQTYLIVKCHVRARHPRLLFISHPDGPVYRQSLDNFYEGESQILLESDSDIVRALKLHSVEVIIL